MKAQPFNMNVFLTKGYDKDGNQVPVLIAYSVIEEKHNDVKILHEYDFRVFGNHSDSIVDDVMSAIKEREQLIYLGSGRKAEVVFNA